MWGSAFYVAAAFASNAKQRAATKRTFTFVLQAAAVQFWIIHIVPYAFTPTWKILDVYMEKRCTSALHFFLRRKKLLESLTYLRNDDNFL